MEYLFAAVVLMGLIQIAIGALRLGKFIRDFRESRVADHSAIDALNKISERHNKVGKRVHLKH